MENTEINNPLSPKISPLQRRILIIVIVMLVLLVGFILYKYLGNNASELATPNSQVNTDTDATPKQEVNVQLENDGVTVEGTNNQGFLTICRDECGNGICQKVDDDCKDGNIDCFCPETPKECPQDCPGNLK